MLRGAITDHPRSASKQVLDAFFAGHFLLLLSRETFQEIQRVLAEEDIRALHGWTEQKLRRFCRALEVRAHFLEPTTPIPASVTRDLTDTKWVSLALDGDAEYLVTLDRRHLQRLKKLGKTKILGPSPFLRVLKASRKKWK